MTTVTSNPASYVPRVGVAVFIVHPVPSAPSASAQSASPPSFRFILGRRLGSHGSNTWALPGGHLEFGESFEACAARETREETDLEIDDVHFLTATNDLMPAPKGDGALLHYATIFMVATVKASPGGEGEKQLPEPKIMEPNKCAAWEWVGWEDLVRWANGREGGRNYGIVEDEESQVHDKEGDRELFTPLLNLLAQRPGVLPRL